MVNCHERWITLSAARALSAISVNHISFQLPCESNGYFSALFALWLVCRLAAKNAKTISAAMFRAALSAASFLLNAAFAHPKTIESI